MKTSSAVLASNSAVPQKGRERDLQGLSATPNDAQRPKRADDSKCANCDGAQRNCGHPPIARRTLRHCG